MVFHGFSWFFMVFHGFSWFFMIFHGFSWFSMVFHGFSWFQVGFSWFFMVSGQFSWFFLVPGCFFLVQVVLWFHLGFTVFDSSRLVSMVFNSSRFSGFQVGQRYCPLGLVIIMMMLMLILMPMMLTSRLKLKLFLTSRSCPPASEPFVNRHLNQTPPAARKLK